MNKKTTLTKAVAPSSADMARCIEGKREKSALGKSTDRLSEPFVSLNKVIEEVARANGGSFREAARRVRILHESEDDFPSWFRWTDAKSKGKVEPGIGAEWGPKLMQHAELLGEPVEYPHRYYRGGGVDLLAMPEGSVYHFLVSVTLGFQINAIGPFLTNHGLSNAFSALDGDFEPSLIGDSATESLTFDWCATKKELQDAFGVLRLPDSWFDGLKDHTWLLSARKRPGVGGRNGSPALFCPYEVMQGLRTKVRGDRITEPAARNILRTKFQVAHAKFVEP